MLTYSCAHVLFYMTFCLSINLGTSNNSTADNIEHVENLERLRTDILSNYSNSIRPNASTELYISFVLMSLNDLSIENQEMSLMVILHTIWYDERLKWNPSDYGGVEGLIVDVNDVWSPAIFVQNSVKSIKLLGSDNMPFRVWYTGRVLWAPFAMLDTSCEMQVLYFPFEEQECSVMLFPNGYLSSEISLHLQNTKEPINLFYYEPNAEWEFLSGSTGNSSLADGTDTYVTKTFTMKFRRRWLFMALSLIFPAILNLVLMLGVFTLHIESGEKMGYSLTVLLSYIVLMTLVGDMLPQVSTQISLLQVYLVCVLLVGCISTLLTIWVINIYNRDDERQQITPTIKFLLKWCVFPVTSMMFWRYVKWRFIDRQNKINGQSASVNPCGDKNKSDFIDKDTTSSVPPISNYSPCSLDTLPPDSKMELRKLTKMFRSDSVRHQRNVGLGSTTTKSDTEKMAIIYHQECGTNGKSSPQFLASETEMSLYSDAIPSPPPPPMVSPSKDEATNEPKHEIDEKLDEITWKDVAFLMDSFLLRSLGGSLLLFTLVVLIILFARY